MKKALWFSNLRENRADQLKEHGHDGAGSVWKVASLAFLNPVPISAICKPSKQRTKKRQKRWTFFAIRQKMDWLLCRRARRIGHLGLRWRHRRELSNHSHAHLRRVGISWGEYRRKTKRQKLSDHLQRCRPSSRPRHPHK